MVELSTENLRVVTSYAAACARDVLHLFEDPHPEDPRPRAAIDAARAFAEGARRTRLQRTTAIEANRAAGEADDPAAAEAARAAGAAAAAAYLHPLARATQVRHILGAASYAAHARELAAGGDHEVGMAHLEAARRRATPGLVQVLRRYPAAPSGRNRVAQLLSALDTALRSDGPA